MQDALPDADRAEVEVYRPPGIVAAGAPTDTAELLQQVLGLLGAVREENACMHCERLAYCAQALTK